MGKEGLLEVGVLLFVPRSVSGLEDGRRGYTLSLCLDKALLV